MNDTVRVGLVGVQIVYNATAHANETVDVNRTTWSWFNGPGKIRRDGTAQQILIGLRQLDGVIDPSIFSGDFVNLPTYP